MEVPMASIVELPQTSAAEATCEYDRRMLFMSGIWESPGSRFRFRATLEVDRLGRRNGPIFWHALYTHFNPPQWFGTEFVAGSLLDHDLQLEGYEVDDPRLARDLYRLRLSGGEAGSVEGISWTCRKDWSGRLTGKYVFQNRRS
jgi:hypothetical protein